LRPAVEEREEKEMGMGMGMGDVYEGMDLTNEEDRVRTRSNV
jgi:hypothetical protein